MEVAVGWTHIFNASLTTIEKECNSLSSLITLMAQVTGKEPVPVLKPIRHETVEPVGLFSSAEITGNHCNTLKRRPSATVSRRNRQTKDSGLIYCELHPENSQPNISPVFSQKCTKTLTASNRVRMRQNPVLWKCMHGLATAHRHESSGYNSEGMEPRSAITWRPRRNDQTLVIRIRRPAAWRKRPPRPLRRRPPPHEREIECGPHATRRTRTKQTPSSKQNNSGTIPKNTDPRDGQTARSRLCMASA